MVTKGTVLFVTKKGDKQNRPFCHLSSMLFVFCCKELAYLADAVLVCGVAEMAFHFYFFSVVYYALKVFTADRSECSFYLLS